MSHHQSFDYRMVGELIGAVVLMVVVIWAAANAVMRDWDDDRECDDGGYF